MPRQRERPPCELITWGEVTRLCRHLAGQIQKAGFHPDLVVAIGRGGYVPARLLCDYLDLMALTSIKVEHYLSGSTKRREARVRYPLCESLASEVKGHRVLIVDDVNDSGDTLALAKGHVQSFHPAEVRIAVMHDKTVSQFSVDFFARRIVKWRWIIYPWAITEDVTDFTRRLSPPPASLNELQQRLAEEYHLRIPLRTLRAMQVNGDLLTLDQKRAN